MPIEWQRDHKTLSPDVKEEFQREAGQLGLDNLIVEVVKEPGAAGSEGARYVIYITDLERTDRETLKLHGGHGKGWVTEFAKVMKHRRG